MLISEYWIVRCCCIVAKGKNITKGWLLIVAQLSHIRYHDILLRNDVVSDWLSVGTWFGKCCAPGARKWARDLVFPLFVSRTTWFGFS